MTQKVGIIGLGHVGSTIMEQMLVTGVADEYVLLGHTKSKTEANLIDYEDALVNLPVNAHIITDDWSALNDADVLITTLGNVKKTQSSGDRLGELQFTSKMIEDVASKIKESGFHGVLIVISNPLDVITTLTQKLTGLPDRQVIGTGTLLDTARLKRILGHELGINPKSVSGYVVGEHGGSQVVAWSTVSALGMSINQLVDKFHLNLDQIQEHTIFDGINIGKAKGFTNFGIAAAAVRLTKAVLNDAQEELVFSHRLPGETVYYSTPAIIGKNGVEKDIPLPLTDEEKQALADSKTIISNAYSEINDANKKG